LLDRWSARVHQPIFLLAEVLLVGTLPLEVLLVAEEEKELAVSRLLEKKGMILLGSEILEEEKALLFFGALLVIWYSWHLFSSAGWTRGHRRLYLWSLPMHRCADTTIKFVSASITNVRVESVWVKEFGSLP